MDYFPSTVLAPGKMSLYNLWTYGTNVSMDEDHSTWLRVAWFALGILAMKKTCTTTLFSKPHCFVNVENTSLGYPWYDYGGSFSPSPCHFVHFIRLWSRLFWLQIWTSTWTYILYINYTYIWSNPPTTKTPFWQTVIQHGKTSDTQG